MNVFMMDDMFFHDLSDSAIRIDEEIDLLVSNSVFDRCNSSFRGGAILVLSKSVHISRVCCHRCHAVSGGAFLYSESVSFGNDISVALTSPETPTLDDVLNVRNSSFMKRLNFTGNRAKGSCSFQCHLSENFSVSYVICSNGRDGHLTEITNTRGGSVDKLILVNNSYSRTGLNFEISENYAKVTFSDCVFARNYGDKPFVLIVDPIELTFKNCFYFGSTDFGFDNSDITKATCKIPGIHVGVVTYECKGIHVVFPSQCMKIKNRFLNPIIICVFCTFYVS